VARSPNASGGFFGSTLCTQCPAGGAGGAGKCCCPIALPSLLQPDGYLCASEIFVQ
jgi:hypothetical protein